MSGYYGNLKYDVCASCQYTEESTRKNRKWDFLIDKFENRPSSDNKLSKCGEKHAHIECYTCNCGRLYSDKRDFHKKCSQCHSDIKQMVPCKNCPHNKSTDLDNTRANIAYRTDTENDLLGLTRPLSNCDSKKFIPCWADNLGEYGNFIRKPRDCNKTKTIAQPLLCDRDINPTNVHKFHAWDKYEPNKQ